WGATGPVRAGRRGGAGPGGWPRRGGRCSPPGGGGGGRPLGRSSGRGAWNPPIDLLPVEEKFTASRYSSLLPTTTTGLPSPRSGPTAGVDTIFVPWSATGCPPPVFGTTWWLTGAVEGL